MVAREEDLEDEAVEEALQEDKDLTEERFLALVTDQSLVITAEL